MKELTKFFPLTEMATDLAHLLAVIFVYAVAAVAIGLVGNVLGILPIIRIITNIICWLLRIYCAAGIVIVLLKYFKVIK